MIVIRVDGEREVRIRAEVEVKFVKSTMLKSIIDKSTIEGTIQVFQVNSEKYTKIDLIYIIVIYF